MTNHLNNLFFFFQNILIYLFSFQKKYSQLSSAENDKVSLLLLQAVYLITTSTISIYKVTRQIHNAEIASCQY